jgi:hypothetical protein
MIRNVTLNFQGLDAEEQLALKDARSLVDIPHGYRSPTNFYARSSIDFEVERTVGSFWKLASGACGALAGYYLFVPYGGEDTIAVMALAAAAIFAFILYRALVLTRVQKLLLRRNLSIGMVQRDLIRQMCNLRYGEEESEKFTKVLEVVTQITLDSIHAADRDRLHLGLDEDSFYKKSGTLVSRNLDRLVAERNYDCQELRRSFLNESFLQELQRSTPKSGEAA